MHNKDVDIWNSVDGFKITMSRNNALLGSQGYQLKSFLFETFLHLRKRQKLSFLFDVKNVTLQNHQPSMFKEYFYIRNVVCLSILFSSEEMALNVFWLVVHMHREIM